MTGDLTWQGSRSIHYKCTRSTAIYEGRGLRDINANPNHIYSASEDIPLLHQHASYLFAMEEDIIRKLNRKANLATYRSSGIKCRNARPGIRPHRSAAASSTRLDAGQYNRAEGIAVADIVTDDIHSRCHFIQLNPDSLHTLLNHSDTIVATST
jgi:hypothetical protein